MNKHLLEEIKLRLDTNRYELKKLDEFYLKAFAPKGYKESTSYNDYDTIPSGNKEYSIEEYSTKRHKLVKEIRYDEKALGNILNSIKVDEYLQFLKTNTEKIDYLRNVQEYTLKEIANKLGLNKRYIQRVLKKINN